MSLSTNRPRMSVDQEVCLRLCRCKPGETFSVMVLSSEIRGCLTHWSGNNSVYCPGAPECREHQKRDNVWKGYVAAMQWEPRTKLWVPSVFEVTEHCELDMRYRYSRGQVWEIWRAQETKKKRSKTCGKLIETRDEAEIVQSFDILPTLRTVYHVAVIVLDKSNPLPDKTVVPALRSSGPIHLAERTQHRPQAGATSMAEEMKRLIALTNGIGKDVAGPPAVKPE